MTSSDVTLFPKCLEGCTIFQGHNIQKHTGELQRVFPDQTML